MTEWTDSQLIDMLRSAEKANLNKALTILYQNNFSSVAAFMDKNSGQPKDAEDIFQDGLIALYEQVLAGTFKGSSSLKTYLFAICKNLWMKRLRKAATKREISGEDTDFADGEVLALDNMIADEESEAIANLLDQLADDCKKVLLLYYYERKRMKEIATLMGFANEQVAKNKKNRCLNKLKELAVKIIHLKPD